MATTHGDQRLTEGQRYTVADPKDRHHRIEDPQLANGDTLRTAYTGVDPPPEHTRPVEPGEVLQREPGTADQSR
jgi:hypothetical protein